MMDNETRAAFRMGKLANESGFTPEEVFQMVQTLIREEQNFDSNVSAARYWMMLSYTKKLDLVERALKTD